MLHFLVPFIILVIVGIHIIYLHDHGSRNPLGVSSGIDCIPFHPYYRMRDLFGILGMVGFNVGVCLTAPDYFGNAANFIKADPIKTPIHIQPE